jgi:hypothetical protein
MAIAYDAKSTKVFDAASTTLSHTCTGANRLLVVVVTTGDAGDTVSAISYAAAGMSTAIEKSDDAFFTGIYYKMAPASGANDISVTLTSGQDAGIMAVSYTGAHQTSVLGDTSSATSNTVTITAVAADSVLVCGAADTDDTAGVRTASNCTERHDVLQGDGAGDYGGFYGDKIPSGATGNITIGYTPDDSSEIVGAEFLIAPAAGTTLQDVIGEGIIPFPR